MAKEKHTLLQWCTENEKEEFLNEWDYGKNDIQPSDVAPMSNKKRWWKCNKGHLYDASPNSRCSRGTGCPFCSNQRVLAGYNDFESLYPNLSREWSDEDNGGLRPNCVISGSAQKVWWKCPLGHKYDMQINLRAQGLGCPFCSGHRVWPGFNDLASTNPELLLEWDYENNKITPQEISNGSRKKVSWKCAECGHKWEASIANRARGRKCPKCSEIQRRKSFLSGMLSRRGSLAERYPSLLEEWDYRLNSEMGINPDCILPGSHKKAFWICRKCGRNWKADISSRALGGVGCIECSNMEGGKKHIKTVIEKKGSLEENNPELMKEWDYEKNKISPSLLSAGSGKIAWWTCKTCGKNWKARVYNRAKGIGCPYCSKERNSSFPEQAVFYYVSKFFTDAVNGDRDLLSPYELDVYIPAINTAIEYDGQAFHKSLGKDRKKGMKCKEKGIRLIRIREKECPHIDDGSVQFYYDYEDRTELGRIIEQVLALLGVEECDVDVIRDGIEIDNQYIRKVKANSFANAYPKLAKEWNYEKNQRITPEMVSYGSTKKYWWKCSLGHDYLSSPASRAGGNGCPYCSKKKLLSGFNDFETCYPDYAKEWNYEKNYPLKPKQVIGGIKKVWWKCSLGHSYEATMNSRTNRHSGCPICSGLKVLKGYNDLTATSPQLISEWDYEKNKGITPTMVSRGSKTIVWWRCPKGHSYQMDVVSRQKNNCPICASKRVEVGFNDLASLFPKITKEWDYEKNGELRPEMVTPKSSKRVWWKCPKGHSYDTVICWKITDKSECPYCANHKIQEGFNDIFTTNPELEVEWDYNRNTINPKTTGAGSGKKAWWVCKKCGFSWKATIVSRKNGRGCPCCANKRIQIGYNDLFTTNPELEEEWDYSRNTIDSKTICAGSGKKAWWICKKCGFSWSSQIVSRKNGYGCPLCGRKRKHEGKD